MIVNPRMPRIFEKVCTEERSFEKLREEERKHILLTVDRKVECFVVEGKSPGGGGVLPYLT